jgi:hypothetical protein
MTLEESEKKMLIAKLSDISVWLVQLLPIKEIGQRS